MSKSKTPSWDDLDEAEGGESTDGDWINLDAGDEVGGEITDVNLDAGYHGVIEIDGRPFSLNKSIRADMMDALVRGCFIRVRADEDEESFTDDDGETVTYHEKRARFGRQ